MDDINQCSVRTLITKTGIPEDLASKIIEYKRKKSCRPPIRCMKELWRVKGMTSEMFKKIVSNFTTRNSSVTFSSSSTSLASSSRSTSSKRYKDRKKAKRKTTQRKGKTKTSQTKHKTTRKSRSVLKQTARVAPIQRKRSRSKGLQDSSVVSQNTQQNASTPSPLGGLHCLSLNPVSIGTSTSCTRLVVKYSVGGMSQPFAFLPECPKLMKLTGKVPTPIKLSPKDIEKIAKVTKGKEVDIKRSIESWLADVQKHIEPNIDDVCPKQKESHVRIVVDNEVPGTSRGPRRPCSSKCSRSSRTRSPSRERLQKHRKHQKHHRHHHNHHHHHSKHKGKRKFNCNVNSKHYQPVEPSQGHFDNDKARLLSKINSSSTIIPSESQLEHYRKRKLLQEKYGDVKRHRTSGDDVIYKQGQAPPPSLGYCVIL